MVGQWFRFAQANGLNPQADSIAQARVKLKHSPWPPLAVRTGNCASAKILQPTAHPGKIAITGGL
jgi:hypothetical protein